jgi:catecholate siderophore receptor
VIPDLRSSACTGSPLFIALGCVGFIASAAPAFAQSEAPAASDLPVLGSETVVGKTIEEDGVKVDESASPKYVAPLLDTPQTVTVISNQTIRQQNLLTLRDALTTVPGITFGAGEGGGGYGDSINLRGQSLAQTGDVMIDGMRDTAQYSRSDTFNLEQIEVVNGANSVYGGAGSVAGGINLISKLPKGEDLTVVQAGIGTDDYFRATVDSNLKLTDTIAVRLNGMWHRNDVPGRDFDTYKRWGVAPSITFGIGTPTSVTLQYVHQEDDNTPQYGVPYFDNGFYDGPLPGVPDSGYFGYKNVDFQEQRLDRATVTINHQINESVSLRNMSRWQHIASDTVVNQPQGTWCLQSGLTQLGVACSVGQVPGTFYPSRNGTARFQTYETLYNQLDLTMDFKGGHRLVIGTSYLFEDFAMTNGNVLRTANGSTPNPPLDPIDISDPDAIYTGPINFIQAGAQEATARNAAVYAFGLVKLTDQLELNMGARLERATARFRQDTHDTPAAGGAIIVGPTQRANDTLISFRAGLVYKPVENASLYVAYGNSRNPTSTSVRSGCGLVIGTTNSCDVPPEKAVNYEIGGKIDLADGRLQLTAGLFRNERTNFRVASNDPLLGVLPVNDGRSKVDGIALGASGHITPDWAIFANYTYLHSVVKQSIADFCVANPGVGACPLSDPQAGNALTNIPKHAGSAFTTYTFPFGLQIGYGLTYQGSFFTSNVAPLRKAEDYLTHRLFASMPIRDRLTAQLNVQNVTNEHYYHSIRNSTGNAWALPGEARSAVLSLYYSF